MAKVSKFQQQIKAKKQQINKIVKSVIPVEHVTLTAYNGTADFTSISIHCWLEGNLLLSIHDWDDSVDNRQRIRESYDANLAKQ